MFCDPIVCLHSTVGWWPVASFVGRFQETHNKGFRVITLKGHLRSKKGWAQMKEREKCKKNRAITDLNAPDGSRDIPFQSQEFGEDGYRHFVGFQPHFQLNMTSQTQYCKTMKKWKCNMSGVFFLICLKLCRLLELGKGILLHFKFCCYGNQNQNYCPLMKKQKVYCLSKSNV